MSIGINISLSTNYIRTFDYLFSELYSISMVKALMEKRILALKLRAEGKSYSQIKDIINVSKSSLSLWLKDHPLDKETISKLRDKNPKRIEKYRNSMRAKREARLKSVYNRESAELMPLSKRELLIGGYFLYWGEGAKTKPFESSLSNTNPAIVKFFIKWLIISMGVPNEKIRVRLHLYSDMDEKSEITFWSNQLNIPIKQFCKTYTKMSTLQGLSFKTFGHGTCNIRVSDRDLTEKIFANLQIITDKI